MKKNIHKYRKTSPAAHLWGGGGGTLPPSPPLFSAGPAILNLSFQKPIFNNSQRKINIG